jgi:hypothetical protein
MIGVGQGRQEPSDEEVAKAAALWGSDLVHPTSAAYRVIAESLEEDIHDTGAKYTNRQNLTPLPKNPATIPVKTVQDGSADARLPCRDMTLALLGRPNRVPLVVEAGRLCTGGNVPTTAAAPLEVPSAGLSGETASGNSPVDGEEDAFSLSVKLITYHL